MTDYDSMSVHDLLAQYVHNEGIRWDDHGEIESALRRAVIREASAGVATIEVLQGRRRIHSNAIRQLPNGNYDLIPKATP